MAEDALNAFVTMFVLIDPISLAPLFVALTGGMPRAARLRVGLTALAVAAGVLGLFALVGDALLGGIGISMAAFRIAGGMLLFLTALDMLFERRTARRERNSAVPGGGDDDPAVFPLAIPLIAGPGAIASVILLMGRHEGELAGQAMVLGVTLAVLGLVLLAFLVAGPLERLLGRVGVLVVTRLLGMLLAALSVQFVLDGLADFGVPAG